MCCVGLTILATLMAMIASVSSACLQKLEDRIAAAVEQRVTDHEKS